MTPEAFAVAMAAPSSSGSSVLVIKGSSCSARLSVLYVLKDTIRSKSAWTFRQCHNVKFS